MTAAYYCINFKMKNFDKLILLTAFIYSGHSVRVKEVLAKNTNNVNPSLDSHEVLHSRNDRNNTIINNLNDSKTDFNKSLTPTNVNSVPVSSSKNHTVIAAEGGIEFGVNKATFNHIPIDIKNPHRNAKIEMSTSFMNINLTKEGKPLIRRIHGRPGVNESDKNSINNKVSSVPAAKKNKKPVFTMLPGDKEKKESDSFIESSTTGKDYILFIVLIILSIPLVFYVIKIIYQRGTEFTERQQYHRMYLIDGMYNSR